MSYGLEDLAPHIKKLEKDQQVKVFDHMRQVQGVGVVMSELQADPRWAVYGNHLEGIKQRYKQSQDGAERLLLDGKFMNSETYGMAKIAQAEYRGVVKGIVIAMSIAKELIESGEAAAKIVADMAEKENS